MPNFVANRITFLGKNDKKALRKYIKLNDNKFDFDFNVAIQMPKGMERIVAGNITDDAVKVYLNHLYLTKANDLLEKIDDVYSYASFVLDCQAKYGAKDWYDWGYKYWGTKWNACDTEYNEGSNSVFFYTAWSYVPNIVKQISKDNPNIIVGYEFAEEQEGYFAGFSIYEKGDLGVEYLYPEYSSESYSLWRKLWEKE